MWIYALPGVVVGRVLPLLLRITVGVDAAAVPGLALLTDKLFLYYASRCIAACFCVAVEIYFLLGVRRRFGDRVARIAMLMLASAAGMANSAASFLPSTYAMYCAFAAGGAILRLECARLEIEDVQTANAAVANVVVAAAAGTSSGADAQQEQQQQARVASAAAGAYEVRLRDCHVAVNLASVRCIWAACLGAVVGWPFAALSMVPFAAVVLRFSRPVVTFPLREAAVALIGCSVAVSIFDGYFYCKGANGDGVFSTWNLIKYNVFSGGGSADQARGPELYGVEPWRCTRRRH